MFSLLVAKVSCIYDRGTTKLDWVDEKKQNLGLAKPKCFAFDPGSLEKCYINLQVHFSPNS